MDASERRLRPLYSEPNSVSSLYYVGWIMLHVCREQQSNQIQQNVLQVESYCQPTFKHYFARCAAPNGEYRLCSRYTTMYHIAYRRRYVPPSPPADRYECCPGWRQAHKYAKGCTEAICTQECQNGGRCLRPNTCACPAGWTGQYCEIDINECEGTSHGCQQRCENKEGSFACKCQTGFTLAEDGKSCAVCLTCTPEYDFLLARVNLLERDVAQLRHNQSAHAAAHAAASQPVPKQPLAISALPLPNDQYIAQMQRVESLSEQISMLEERLADCSCRRRNNKGRR
ncbi:epidermal growth factor-like protein 7 [Lytechinus pictus]|uniref:epidermal growth factor-like protein 7 n=1 Tax=Lytechinus pictus TaxID=7653 RepID=UPI0030B9F96E